jgi:hypothetical protein
LLKAAADEGDISLPDGAAVGWTTKTSQTPVEDAWSKAWPAWVAATGIETPEAFLAAVGAPTTVQLRAVARKIFPRKKGVQRVMGGDAGDQDEARRAWLAGLLDTKTSRTFGVKGDDDAEG